MNNLTQAQALSEIRTYARNLGMTFKRQNVTINGQAAYMLTNRKTGEVLAKSFNLFTAYDSMKSGYFDKVAQNI